MKKALVGTALSFVAILAFSLFGCGGGGKTEVGDGYKIENQKLIKKGDDAYVTGTVTNTSDKEHDILLSWYAYDSGKNGIGVAQFNANDIKPNEKYEFEVPFLDSTGDKNIRHDTVKDYAFAEAHFTDVEHQEYLDNLGEKYKGEGYTLKNMEMVTTGDEPYVKGKFVNESGSTMRATLEFDLLDKKGKRVGKSSKYIDKDIKDGETVDFKTDLSYPVDGKGEMNGGTMVKSLVSSFKYNPEDSNVYKTSS